MFDILPSEMDSWCHLENEAIRLVEAYGYREIRTPIFENKDLYINALGRDSGMVQNKLWTVKSPGGENLTLRPDFTSSVLRACNEHGLYQNSGFPTKLFYSGPVFWKGNGRTASNWMDYQFGLESIGSADPSADVEVIMMVNDLCQALGLPRVRVHINTLGCSHCRSRYHQVLTEFFARHTGELCETCRSRYKSRPQWVMGCNEEGCRNITAWVPSIHSYLCEECESHFKTVCDYLSELKVDCVVDPQVARDVDCYNRTIFHIACYGRVVAYGGRYDGLSERLVGSDKDTAEMPAVGCSIDVIPLLKLLDELQVKIGKYSPLPKVCFVGEGPEAVQLLLPVLYALRRSGVCAELFNREIPSDDRLPDISPAQFIVGLPDENVRSRSIVLFDGDLGVIETRSLDDALTIIGRTLGVKDLSSQLRPLDTRHWSIAARSHHTLDNNGRGRHQNELPARSRGRRVAVKGDVALVSAPRESRSRKGSTGYAVPAAREKNASTRLRNRRRPETEDSLETVPVRVTDGLVPPVYPEPLLPGSRREIMDRDLPKSSKYARHLRNEGVRKRSDRVLFSEMESMAYGPGSLDKGPSLRKRDLKALAFEVAADSDRLIYHPEEDEFLELMDPTERRGKRHSRSGRLGRKTGPEDVGYEADISYQDSRNEDVPGEAEETSGLIEGGILDTVNRWASERYGIEGNGQSSVKDLAKRNILRGSSRNSRGGRKGLARIREWQTEGFEEPALASIMDANLTGASEELSEQPLELTEVLEKSTPVDSEATEVVVEVQAEPVRKMATKRARTTSSRRTVKAKAKETGAEASEAGNGVATAPEATPVLETVPDTELASAPEAVTVPEPASVSEAVAVTNTVLAESLATSSGESEQTGEGVTTPEAGGAPKKRRASGVKRLASGKRAPVRRGTKARKADGAGVTDGGKVTITEGQQSLAD